jgi:hypothetical protein
MALTQVPAVAGLTRNIQAFTSSTTWTVPSTAQYVDVLVVGGGCGGRGGYRQNTSGNPAGAGGAVTILKNIFLGGTGTVSITVGAGSNGTTGTASGVAPSWPSASGFSAFGDFVYSGGAFQDNGGLPGRKSTTNYSTNYNIGSQAEVANYAPSVTGPYSVSSGGGTSTSRTAHGLGVDLIGLSGGLTGISNDSGSTFNNCGTPPGSAPHGSNDSIRLWTLSTPNWFNVNSYLGAATAGTTAGAGGTAGPAGVVGLAGGGGTAFYGSGQHGQGGPGAGGGGGNGGAQLGGSGNGGNGGNAGTNTGAGGGGGGNCGSTSVGTGGNGGNGASGIVVVSWLG